VVLGVVWLLVGVVGDVLVSGCVADVAGGAVLDAVVDEPVCGLLAPVAFVWLAVARGSYSRNLDIRALPVRTKSILEISTSPRTPIRR
jgi:hypothetical protein